MGIAKSEYVPDSQTKFRQQLVQQECRLARRAKALGADLKHRLGVSYEKAGDLLWTALGLPVTRSGLCQADGRLAKKARPVV